MACHRHRRRVRGTSLLHKTLATFQPSRQDTLPGISLHPPLPLQLGSIDRRLHGDWNCEHTQFFFFFFFFLVVVYLVAYHYLFFFSSFSHSAHRSSSLHPIVSKCTSDKMADVTIVQSIASTTFHALQIGNKTTNNNRGDDH